MMFIGGLWVGRIYGTLNALIHLGLEASVHD